ncbi:hypothetical protein ACWFOS_20205 [Gordonia terrae]
MRADENGGKEEFDVDSGTANQLMGGDEVVHGEERSGRNAPAVPSMADDRYHFDPEDAASVAAVLDHAFGERLLHGWEGWTATEDAIKAVGVEPSESLKRVMVGITCRPIELSSGLSAELVCEGYSLPALSETTGDVLQLWKSVLSTVTEPAAQARLGELLMATERTSIGLHLTGTVNAYLSAVAGKTSLGSTTYLVRVHTLCRTLNAAQLKGVVLGEIEDRIDTATGEQMLDHPGIYFPLLKILAESTSRKGGSPKVVVADVLEELASTVTVDYLASSIASMRRKVADMTLPDVARTIAEQEVAGHLRSADVSTHPATEMLHLESAAKIATQRGLPELATEIAARMQALGNEDLGLEVIRTTGQMPEWAPESYLRKFTESHTWRGGLHLFMMQLDPPSGQVKRHREFAESQRGSLASLLPPMILGRDNLPRVTLSASAVDTDRHNVALSGRITAETFGRFGVEALSRMRTVYGVPDLDELTVAICEIGARDVGLARSLARGFLHFWRGDYESCLAVVTPRIEAAARALLRELDEGIYQVQVAKSPGGYAMLHSLLERLEDLALDPDWAWFLRWLLLGDVGANVRNDQAHGFFGSVPPEYAVMTLRAASILITAAPVIDGTTKRLTLRTELSEVSAWRGPADRLLWRAQKAALTTHIRLDKLRRLLRTK